MAQKSLYERLGGYDGIATFESDWSIFLKRAGETMKALGVPEQECAEIAAFVGKLKGDIVEA